MEVRARLVARFARLGLALSLAGCVGGADPISNDEALVVTSACRVSGAGTLATGESMSGDIHDDAGTAVGSWTHTLGTETFVGSPDVLTCRINGSTIADVMGTGSYEGVPGYSFTLHVQDRGDPSSPTRLPGPPETRTITASRTYSPSRWTDGTVDFADGALLEVPASLPVTVGNAGNGWTHLTFVDHDSGESIRCMYRGGAAHACPSTPSDTTAGLTYTFARCERLHCDPHPSRCDECAYETDGTIVPGTTLDVDSIELHVQSGSNRHPSYHSARTTVALSIEVSPFTTRPAEPDYYRFLVFDPSGAVVMLADGDVASGDLAIVRTP